MTTHTTKRGVHLLAPAALGALVLTACSEKPRLSDAEAVRLHNPEQRHAIGFATRKKALDIEMPPGAEGLSPNQHADVYRFIDAFKKESGGRITIATPAPGRTGNASARTLTGIYALMSETGTDYRLVRSGARYSETGVPAIRLSYEAAVAIPPQCDLWTTDQHRNPERIPYENWGCATQRNLAVMVNNGRDLMQPQNEDPRVGERRHKTWTSYAGSTQGSGGGEEKSDMAAPKGGPPTAAKE
jgi:pilus assembly protein CpaD